jgi:hypothetical protein
MLQEFFYSEVGAGEYHGSEHGHLRGQSAGSDAQLYPVNAQTDGQRAKRLVSEG